MTMGRISVDLYPEQIDVALEDVSTFAKSLGGSPTNVAVAAARLGASAAVITKVGDDPFGVYSAGALREFGVDDALRRHPPDAAHALVVLRDPPARRLPAALLPRAEGARHGVDGRRARPRRDPRGADLWITGTGLSEEPSRAATLAALEARGGRDGQVLDLDHRPMFWADPAEAAAMDPRGAALRDGRGRQPRGGRGRRRHARPRRRPTGCSSSASRSRSSSRARRACSSPPVTGASRSPPVPTEVVCGLGAGDAFGGSLCYGLLQGLAAGACVGWPTRPDRSWPRGWPAPTRCRPRRTGRSAGMRLTVAQALVRFLAAQRLERDGESSRFFAGCLGIFGHGNVAGMGQALQQHATCATTRRATSRRWSTSPPPTRASATGSATWACTSSVGPGATNMVTGAALATVNRLPVLLLPGRHVRHAHAAPGAPAARGAARRRCCRSTTPSSRCRATSTGSRGPSSSIAAALEAMRVLTDPAETGAVTLALPEDVQTEAFDVPGRVPRAARWTVCRRPAAPEALARAAELIRGAQRPLIVAGGGVIYSEATARAARVRRRHRHPGVRDPGRARRAASPTIPLASAPSARPARPRRTALAARGRRRDRRRHALERLHDRVEDRVPGPGRALRQHQRHRVRRGQARRAGGRGRRARGARARCARRSRASAPPRVDARGRGEARASGRPRSRGWSAPAPTAGRCAGGDDRRGQRRRAARPAWWSTPPGSTPGDLHKLWRARDPEGKGYHVEYGYSCMGYEIPGGMGIKLAAPEREVCVLVGDGS